MSQCGPLPLSPWVQKPHTYVPTPNAIKDNITLKNKRKKTFKNTKNALIFFGKYFSSKLTSQMLRLHYINGQTEKNKQSTSVEVKKAMKCINTYCVQWPLVSNEKDILNAHMTSLAGRNSFKNWTLSRKKNGNDQWEL